MLPRNCQTGSDRFHRKFHYHIWYVLPENIPIKAQDATSVSLHRQDSVSSTTITVTRRKMDAANATVLSTFQFGKKEIQDRDDGLYIYSTQHPEKNILISYNRLLVLIFPIFVFIFFLC